MANRFSIIDKVVCNVAFLSGVVSKGIAVDYYSLKNPGVYITVEGAEGRINLIPWSVLSGVEVLDD